MGVKKKGGYDRIIGSCYACGGAVRASEVIVVEDETVGVARRYHKGTVCEDRGRALGGLRIEGIDMTDEKKTDVPEGWDRVPYHEFPAKVTDWDQTPAVSGVLIWRETVITKGLDGQDRPATMYAIANSDGEEVGVWSTANLEPQLAKVEDGTEVLIRYLGTDKLSGARTMRRFEVYTHS